MPAPMASPAKSGHGDRDQTSQDVRCLGDERAREEASVGRLETGLFGRLFQAAHEAVVNRAAGERLALQPLQSHLGLRLLERPGLKIAKRLLDGGLTGCCGLQFLPQRGGDQFRLRSDVVLRGRQARFQTCHDRAARSENRALRGEFVDDFPFLDAVRSDDLRLPEFRNDGQLRRIRQPFGRTRETRFGFACRIARRLEIDIELLQPLTRHLRAVAD